MILKKINQDKSKFKSKAIILPKNIANQGVLIKEALEKENFNIEICDYYQNIFYKENQSKIDKDKLIVDAKERFNLVKELIENYDIFYFHGGESLLPFTDPYLPPMWDLPLLKSLGKKIIMHFHGSELRIPRLHIKKNKHSLYQSYSPEAIEYESETKLEVLKLIELYADEIFVSTEDLLTYSKKAIHIPLLVSEELYCKEFLKDKGDTRKPLTVVHIPSNRINKGSDLIRNSLQPLIKDKIIDYREYDNLSNDKVAKILENTDILIDGMVLGAYGLISLEASLNSCLPVADLCNLPKKNYPVYDANLENLAEKITLLSKNRELLKKLTYQSYCLTKELHNREKTIKLLSHKVFEMKKLKISTTHYPSWPIFKKNISQYTTYINQLSYRSMLGADLSTKEFIKLKLINSLKKRKRIYYQLRKIKNKLKR